MPSRCGILLLGLALALQTLFSSQPANADDAKSNEPTPLIRDIDVGYLLNVTFTAASPYCAPEDIRLTGWETDKSGGTWNYSPKGYGFAVSPMSLDWFKLIDVSDKAAVTIKHKIVRQTTGRLVLEYRFKMPRKMDGVAWQLCDLKRAGVSIVTANGNLCYETPQGKPVVLQPYDAECEYGVKAVVDVGAKITDIYVDGERKATAAPFCRPIDTIDYVLIKTGDAATGELALSPVNVHKGYAVCETFVTSGRGKMPADWTLDAAGGAVAVDKFPCGAPPDIYSLKLTNAGGRGRVSAGKSFSPLGKKTVCEFRFELPEKRDGVAIELCSGGKAAVKLVTANGNLCYMDDRNQAVPLASNYLSNLWYTVKLAADPTASKADIYINGKLTAKEAAFNHPIKSFNAIQFASTTDQGVMWVDDVRVYAWQDYPADYVPQPVPCPTRSPYILCLQSASIWREGDAYAGWDWIYPHAATRKPYLGWYDQGHVEETDWEIKWQVEHGIDFELYCWYRPDNAVNNPIKDTPLGHSIIDGLFNSRYSHLKKFAIMYENNLAGRTNMEDFQKNIIPYWIEYFFKDPRYMKIDGKPLLSFYWHPRLATDFGGVEGARKAVGILREQCAKAGFPGVVLLMQYMGSDPVILKSMKAMGADYFYSYTFFNDSSKIDTHKACNLAQRDAAAKAGLNALPLLTVGWEPSVWGMPGKGLLAPKDYRTMVEWLKNEYMLTLPADSLGRRMLMLANWCEFGEGAYIMPSTLAGFGYLDALREAFTAGGPHTDIAPTNQQKRRFNVLYPKD